MLPRLEVALGEHILPRRVVAPRRVEPEARVDHAALVAELDLEADPLRRHLLALDRHAVAEEPDPQPAHRAVARHHLLQLIAVLDNLDLTDLIGCAAALRLARGQ